MSHRSLRVVVCVWMLASAGASRADEAALSGRAGKVAFEWGVEAPMRDGVNLSVTVYLPRDQPAPHPCLLALTPYIADVHHDQGMYFAANGYPFAIADARGRGNSQGKFSPFIQEARDAHDLVEWLARQTYCNGKVAMWGGSYSGYAQWAAAKEFPPHLASIVPVAAPFIGVDFPMRNNIFYPFIARWLAFTAGRASQPRILGDETFWSSLYRRLHVSGRAFRDLDAMVSGPDPVFQEWLSHPEPDDYWDGYNPRPGEYARLRIPILTITGIYDDDQPGALEHYTRYMRYAAPAARERHYLIIGPWDHAGTRVPRAQFGGLAVGAPALLDLARLHLDWYDWTMRGGRRPEFLREPVAYYVMGADRWRYASSLEEVTASSAPLFLDSTRNASDVFSAGSLRVSRGRGRPDRFTYDPRNVDGPEVDAEARASGGSLVDQEMMFALRGKELVYHSEPFQSDTEISGFFRLSAWISIDCPDTDLYVSIHDVDTKGGSVRLTTDAMRLRYREGLRNPRLIGSRAPLRYEFSRFTFVSRQVRRGHRLRLIIAPIGRLVEATFSEKNYNGGGIVARESVADARPVTVSLYHDLAHQSALYIPLGRPETADESKDLRSSTSAPTLAVR